MSIRFFIGIFIYFLIAPLAIGSFFGGRVSYIDRKDISLQYVLGYLGLLAVFTVYCIPMSLTRKPLHVLNNTTWVMTAVIIGIAVCVNARRFQSENPASPFREFFALKPYWGWIKNALMTIRQNLWILIPMAVIVYQIWRVVAHMTVVYSDDDTYIPIINDMVYNDAILSHDPVTGNQLAVGVLANSKYALSAWLQWEAFLSVTTGIHPLIFIKTVFPVFLIPFHYLIIWVFSRQFLNDTKRRVVLMAFYSFLIEWGSPSDKTNFSYYLLSWSWYGKAFLQFAVMPAVLLFFFLIANEKTGWKEAILLLILVGSGLGSSTMAIILILLELVVLLIIRAIHSGTVRELWLFVPALSPIIVIELLNLANY